MGRRMELTQITLSDILSTVRDAGVIGLLVIIIVGGHRKWWVWGYLYDQVLKERDEWKTLALRGTELADRMVTITKRRQD